MQGFLGDLGRAASTPNMMSGIGGGSMRPSSALSIGSGVSTGTSTSVSAMKMERDLLERMVQERDEKIKTLQKTLDMQKEYINGLQSKNDTIQEKMRQEAARQKLHLQSVNHEKNLIKSQLKVLQKENQRIKNDPIHKALTKTEDEDVNNKNANRPDPPILTKEEEDSINGEDGQDNQEPPQIKILDNDQRCLVLQSQLYQAMNSLSTLQQQTSALKENYDEIVNSLQQELMVAEESKTKMEVKLLSRMTVLEREKVIVEELLQEKISARDSRLKRLEKRIQHLDAIDDDESYCDDGSKKDQNGDDSVAIGGDVTNHGSQSRSKEEIMENNADNDDDKNGNNPNDDGEEEDDDDDDEDNENDDDSDVDSTLGVHSGDSGDGVAATSKRKGLLSELEMLSEHSSTRKLFSNVE